MDYEKLLEVMGTTLATEMTQQLDYLSSYPWNRYCNFCAEVTFWREDSVRGKIMKYKKWKELIPLMLMLWQTEYDISCVPLELTARVVIKTIMENILNKFHSNVVSSCQRSFLWTK